MVGTLLLAPLLTAPPDHWMVSCCASHYQLTKYPQISPATFRLYLLHLVVIYPTCSMYGIFTNILPQKCPNVGKYSIHGASGYGFESKLGTPKMVNSKHGRKSVVRWISNFDPSPVPLTRSFSTCWLVLLLTLINEDCVSFNLRVM